MSVDEKSETQKNSRIGISGNVYAYNLPSVLRGWACDFSNPLGPALRIEARLNDELIGAAQADEFRLDLTHIGHGNYGFRLGCSVKITMTDISEKRLRVVAYSESTQSELSIDERLVRGMDLEGAVTAIRALSNDRLLEAVKQINHALIPKHYDSQSPLFLPVGLASIDGTAKLGKNGFVFLTEGSNHVIGLYNAKPDDHEFIKRIEGWTAVIESRARWCQEKAITYRQVIIPEKITIYPEYFHVPISTPTPQLFELEAKLMASEVSKHSYVSALRVIEHAKQLGLTFGRTGTHLTPLASFKLAQALLSSLGHDVPDREFTKAQVRQGELGNRFFGVPSYEELDYCEENASLQDPVMVYSSNPKSGGHIGRRCSWVCEDAPFRENVVAFGNSFFFVGHDQCDLSWWFSRLFQKFHFIWQPDFNYSLLEELKPDIVVGQTIERYLTITPNK